MKTLLVIDSVSRAAGGLMDAERCLHLGLASLGTQASVHCLLDEHTTKDAPLWAPLSVHASSVRGPAALGWSPDLARALAEEHADLCYRAGLWRWPSRQAHLWSLRHHRPEIIAPHGMLDPWALRNSAWKKRLAAHWFEDRHLHDAACIRALCESEARSVRAYGLRNPIAIIPNGVDLPDLGNGPRTTDNGPKILLFLGRLHPKKGLMNALRAWAQLHRNSETPKLRNSDPWQFLIAGWDQGNHEAELKRLCKDLGLPYAAVPASDFLAENYKLKTENSQILFLGPAFGKEKDLLFRSASAFILPSFSEGLPMAVLEAWAYWLPVLMTDHCNLPEGFAANAALCIGTDVESIAAGMVDLFRLPASGLRSLGQNGRALVEHQFTWPKVAAEMKQVYEWLLGGGDRPECVRK